MLNWSPSDAIVARKIKNGTGTNGIKEPKKLIRLKPKYPNSGEKGRRSVKSTNHSFFTRYLTIKKSENSHYNSKIIKISYFVTYLKLVKRSFDQTCNMIAKISSYIRFVAVVGSGGELLSHYRRSRLKPLLNAKNTKYQFSHIAIKTDLEAFFDKSLGPIEFEWEERKKVQTISFALKKNRIWVSIDKKVVRSEVLRIIDSCLPLVKLYS